MAAKDGLLAEKAFHDSQAQERARTFISRPGELTFADDTYLGHETWIRPAFARLGDVRGLNVLDFGSGHGMAAIVLARRGARVTALDLSTGYLAESRLRCLANGTAANFVQADGHRLPFSDKCFDRVWGNAVLHHLDVHVAAMEIARVLRPGGLAVFCEPWGENPLLNWIRGALDYPGKQRTSGESPLRQADLNVLGKVFTTIEVFGYQLLSMVRRVSANKWLVTGAECCDTVLLRVAPSLQNYCRYVVLTLRR
jgi:SAM-dependent methyltransferase